MSNPSKLHAYSGVVLRLYEDPTRAQTHYISVFVLWAPDSRDFHDLCMQVQPMSELKPLFAGAKCAKSMQVEIEQGQCKGQVLIQYLTSNLSVTSDNTSIAWTLGAWERSKNMKAMRKLERKLARIV